MSRDGAHRNIFIPAPDDVRDILKFSPDLMLRHSAKLCMVSGTPEEMVESCERITSESWIHNLCVGSVCAFVLINRNKVRGVTGVHVDDLLGGGDEVFDRSILEVKREFDFGAWDVGSMKFKESQLTQMVTKSWPT